MVIATFDALISRNDVPARIRRTLYVSPSGCWESTLRKNACGYVQVNFSSFKKQPGLHRYVFQSFFGPVDRELVLDHKCRNRACCNPNHLRVVTKGVNTMENSLSLGAIYKPRMECKNGHEYKPGSFYLRKNARICRACRVDICRRYRARKSAAK